MKKILSLLLVGVMVFSMIPAAYATTDYTNGTQVTYNAADDDTIGDENGDGVNDNQEYYTVTVPALLAPGGSGDVTAKGTWASNRKLNVTADATVILTNTISGADEKVLDVTFAGIALVGSNTAAVSETKPVSVADIEAALFGEWKGKFNYNAEMVDYTNDTTGGDSGSTDTETGDGEEATLITFTIDGTEYQTEDGMTWGEWVESEYNTDGYVIATATHKSGDPVKDIVVNATKTHYVSLSSGTLSPSSVIGKTGYGPSQLTFTLGTDNWIIETE